MLPDCEFCEIANGRSPVWLLKTWPDAVAFTPLNPVTPGHVLIVPKAHVSSFTEDPIVTAATMARAAEYTARFGFPGEGVNLITSAGEAATQTVFHLHVHLVPRDPGDGLKLPWSDQHA